MRWRDEIQNFVMNLNQYQEAHEKKVGQHSTVDSKCFTKFYLFPTLNKLIYIVLQCLFEK